MRSEKYLIHQEGQKSSNHSVNISASKLEPRSHVIKQRLTILMFHAFKPQEAGCLEVKISFNIL